MGARVALATCARLPAHEFDDRPLRAAFGELGVDVQDVVWSDPAVDWSRFDACLIRTTWDYVPRLQEFLAWTESTARQTRLFNEADTVRWNTHKGYLIELEGRGIPVVDTIWIERGSTADIADLVRECGWSKAFLKPAVGLSARGTIRFDADPPGCARAQAHLNASLVDVDFLLQPYVSTVETFGELSAVFIDGELTHTVRKIPVPGDYRVQDDHGGSDEPFDVTPEEAKLAHGVLGALGRRPLYARVDWLRDEAGSPRLVELELVEPSLFFRHSPQAAGKLARALLARL